MGAAVHVPLDWTVERAARHIRDTVLKRDDVDVDLKMERGANPLPAGCRLLELESLPKLERDHVTLQVPRGDAQLGSN